MDDNDYKFGQFLAKKPLFTGAHPPQLHFGSDLFCYMADYGYVN
jgi:hypothetical protein